MRRVICIFFSMVLLVALAACSSGDSGDSSVTSTVQESTVSAAEPEPTSEPEEEPVVEPEPEPEPEQETPPEETSEPEPEAVELDAPSGSGTATCKASGYGGPVQVTMTVEDGTITELDVDGDFETVGIGSNAVDQLPEQILAANGLEGVDAVAGATVSSDAIFKACRLCFGEIAGN